MEMIYDGPAKVHYDELDPRASMRADRLRERFARTKIRLRRTKNTSSPRESKP